MKFQFGQFEILTDVNKNRAIYKELPLVSDNCQCGGCINYQKAIISSPKEVISFFKSLGMNIQKPTEIYVFCSEDDRTKLLYGGFYHLTGKVITGKSAWCTHDDGSGSLWWDRGKTFELSDDFRVSFQSECSLLEREFTVPAIQMEVEFHVPWVLDEANQYR